MKIKINGSEVEQLTKKLDELTLDLYNEIKGCRIDMESIKNSYKSVESGLVIDTCTSYFENLRLMPFTYNELNNLIKKANNIYEEEDSDFLKEIQKENSEELKNERDLYKY